MEQKLLFGLTLETSRKMRDVLETEINRRCPGIQSVCRYRKEGVYQYLSQQEDAIVIIEETLQGGSPYTTEELQQLTDLGGHHIIYLMDQSHRGDDYVKELYACGIYDALYLDQATVKDILKLIIQGRTCYQAREYYGIRNLRDAERQNNIINEERLGTYLEFVEAADSDAEVDSRYRFASAQLGVEENRALSASISRSVAERLCGNEIYQFYKSSKGTKERRRILPWNIGKKKNATQAEMNPSSVSDLAADPDVVPLSEQVARLRPEEPVDSPREVKTEKARVDQDFETEDMLAILERFRSVADEIQTESYYQPEEDLREILGGFLQTVDV